MKLSNLSLLIGLDLVTSVISQVSVSGGGTVLLPQPSIAASSTAKGAPFTNSSSTIIPSNASHSAPYWLEQIPHLGVAPLSSNGSYKVFRNVKDFGAKGDGVTDDTAAINKAISSGGRCEPGVCQSTTTTPAVVYFPAGTYLISSSIIDYYLTQIIGNPNDLPVLKATSNFTGFGLIDGDPYGANGLGWNPTNVFYRQVRNLVFDLRGISPNSAATGIHWPSAQATSLQNCVFEMSAAAGTQHQGLFIESELSGSGGFMNDLVFNGGNYGARFGNQQYTVRNLTFNNIVTAIDQLWNWGWTYQGITVNNCSTGLNMSAGGAAAQSVVSVTLIDSSFYNTKVGIATAYNAISKPDAAGGLVLDNVSFQNVPAAIQGPQGTVLTGDRTVNGWSEGNTYSPYGPTRTEGFIRPFSRSSTLSPGGNFYARSKPQYEHSSPSEFISVRTGGATGNGVTDDTAALNAIFAFAAAANKIVYIDAGTYKVSSTVFIPSGSRIVGESYPVILGAGAFFSSIRQPQPVVQVGYPFQKGIVEWSDTVVSTQGATSGAILIQWNLASPTNSPSGAWDVHTRIGGFAGSELQRANCPTTPDLINAVNQNCIAAFMSIHITENAQGIYFENNWFWVADHDIEHPQLYQITIYAGRGLYCESKVGNIWLVGTAVEHHTLYQYQFANTKNIFAGQIQTETAYYQPNPNALQPIPYLRKWNDPNFEKSCRNATGNCANGWGLRIVDSESVHVYGAGLYSFFNNYNTSCSDQGNNATCQSRIFSLEGKNKDIGVYNLNTIGTHNMITSNGQDIASYKDNIAGYPEHITLFTTEGRGYSR
ncbi:glycoside hydrolase family 55 protein [Rutstroemia sp. NJR-2017a WRK4]|nr:glycoside hydrolase family 55 protein [Rutstroemia sp. NJR-2017a WRK4]